MIKDRQDKCPVTAEYRSRLRWMLLLGLVVCLVAGFSGFREVAYGVLSGLPIAAANFYLMVSTIRAPIKDPMKAQARLMLHAFIRMMICFLSLALAVQVSIHFMTGVAIGLMAQMLTYFGDALKDIRNG